MAENRNLTRNSQPEEPLSVVNHRPYPLPKRPWSMIQRWNDLLFAHWPIPATQLEALLPPGLQVDTFDQSAWLGVVPFWMDRVQLRGVPRIPGASRFPELNLRTYVRERNTNRAGVYFFCLEASNPLAVMLAHAFFHLPYHWARMSVKARGEREFTYQSARLLSAKPVRFRAHYRGLGQVRTMDAKPPGNHRALSHRALLPLHNHSSRATAARRHSPPALAPRGGRGGNRTERTSRHLRHRNSAYPAAPALFA